MKVKIGSRVYSSDQMPIMIILSDQDKQNIANMSPECTKLAEFPQGTDRKIIDRFMETNDDKIIGRMVCFGCGNEFPASSIDPNGYCPKCE